MNKENNAVKFLKFYIKNFYYVWYALLAACLALIFIKNEPEYMMPVVVILLLAGTWLQRNWKKAVCEIRIEGEHVEIDLYDNTTITLGMAHIVAVQNTSTGVYIYLSNKDEYKSLKGNLGAVIKKDGAETRMFKQEDFPYARFEEKK